MRHKNMIFDVMVLNMERQLVELAHERFGKPLEKCTDEEAYYIVMELTKRVTSVCEKNSGEKKAYIISTDYLPGCLLGKNLLNLGIRQRMRDVLMRYGKNLASLEKAERELRCGQGSLGVAAASIMDSVTMLGYPIEALGLHYGPGINPRSREGYSGVLRMDRCDEEFWGSCANLSFDAEMAGCRIRSRMHVIHVVGYVGGVSTVKLFDPLGNLQDIAGKGMTAEERFRQLAGIAGPESLMSLCRQYFLATNAAQMILREMKVRKYDLRKMDDHAVIQICGANAGLIIPELIRIFVEDKAVNFIAAAAVVISACAYTVFASPSEKMQTWPVTLMQQVLPQLMPIIEQMQEIVSSSYEDERLQIIDKDGIIHMERICLHFTSSASYVSQTQAKIMTAGRHKSFLSAYPERFAVRTTGISFRRWLMVSNPALTDWIDEQIGGGFRTNTGELENLHAVEPGEDVFRALLDTKKQARRRLSSYLSQYEGESFLRGGVIDVLTGPVTLRSAQLAAHYTDHRIAMIRDGVVPERPINFIFVLSAPADAAAASQNAQIRQILQELKQKTEQDPLLSPHLKVVLIHDFSITCAQVLFPAADICEEMTPPEDVSAGTGKMKCMVNGVVMLGREGSCAEEVRELVGEENIYMFSDERSYITAKDHMFEDFEDRPGWARKMLVYIAKSCHYSSDLTAQAYNKDIWKLL